MPAYFEEGFFVRRPAWHGLGVVLDEYPGREEAMRLAGHNFEIIETDLFTAYEGTSLVPDIRKVKGWKALKRDTGEVEGCARDSYTVIQNDTCWDVVDLVVNQPNVRYETGGRLGNGILWVLAWLDEPVTITGDISPIYPFIHGSWAHNGISGLNLDNTNIRVVCFNTYSAARSQAERQGKTFSFRHTKNVSARIEEAREALGLVRAKHNAFIDLAEELVTIPITSEQREIFVTSFIPKPIGDVVSDRVMDNIEEARAMVRMILDSESLGALPDTGYKLLQAGIEYLDHGRKFRSKDSYFNRSVLKQEPLKDKLVPLIKDVALM